MNVQDNSVQLPPKFYRYLLESSFFFKMISLFVNLTQKWNWKSDYKIYFCTFVQEASVV